MARTKGMTFEPVEHSVLHLRRDAGSLIGHREHQRVWPALRCEHDGAALGREPDRVREQIEQHLPDAPLVKALAEFRGVGRRFQRYGDPAVRSANGGGHFTLIDDYGHHPVEMAAVIAAARGAFPGRRLVIAFQPHRYTRTRDCFEDFVKVMGSADAVLLAEVYAAGEAPIVAADGRSLARALRVAGKVDPIFVDDIAQMPEAIAAQARDGDVVIAMGAGSIGAVPGQVLELLKEGQ
jgi:UDP-N-acetylmuramate--alanine ligase